MIAFLDLNRLNRPYKERFLTRLADMVENRAFVLGDLVKNFEKKWAAYTGAPYAVGVSNGSDALFLILEAYKLTGRLHEGDRVLVPANTYIATILPVVRAGLVPVAAEPDAETLNLSVSALEKHQNISACIAVHLYGRLTTDHKFQAACRARNILLIEDAAQAHGARNETGKAGNLGDAAAWSFYPTKNLGALGDAGAVTTEDKELASLISILRHYGQVEKYNSRYPGLNARLDALQAAFLEEKLGDLDQLNARRIRIARQYTNGIRNPYVQIPRPVFDGSHVYHQFVILSPYRDALREFLKRQGIQTLVHYPVPPHRQAALAGFLQGAFPVTERIHREILSLPVDPYLSETEQNRIIDAVNAFKP